MTSIPVTRVREFLPYEVGRVVVQPGARPYTFHVKLRSEALTSVGIIGTLGEIFARFKVNILLFKASATGDIVRLIVIADLKGAENLAPRIAEEIKRMEFCEDVAVHPPLVDGIAVDTVSFPLLFSGERAVIMREIIYEGLFKSGWERFGTAYAALMYSAGFEAGRNAFRSHSRITPSPEAQLRVAETFFQLLGYGILEIIKIDDTAREAVVRVYHSFECELFKGAGEPRGSFMRGLIAGWLAERWRVAFEEMVSREEKCIAKGEEFCEYRFSARRKK